MGCAALQVRRSTHAAHAQAHVCIRLYTCRCQYCFGSKENFYEYRFITKKDPDDLASFYGSEDFMCVRVHVRVRVSLQTL